MRYQTELNGVYMILQGILSHTSQESFKYDSKGEIRCGKAYHLGKKRFTRASLTSNTLPPVSTISDQT